MQIFNIVLIILCSAIIGYIFGSIPNAIIIGKLFFKKDPREIGSKNPGATNIGRNFGLFPGIVVIILDALKITLPFIVLFLCYTKIDFFQNLLMYSSELNYFGRGNTICQLAYWISPLFGVLGHCYSVFIKFYGGKAVSSFLGFGIGSSWVIGPFFAIIFLITAQINKHVSVASIISAASVVIFSWIVYILYIVLGSSISNYLMYFGYGPEICIYFPIEITLCFLIVLFRHKQNIKNLKEGKESIAFWINK